jgi:hypothetical protein
MVFGLRFHDEIAGSIRTSASILSLDFDSSALTFGQTSRLERSKQFLRPFFGEYRGELIL